MKLAILALRDLKAITWKPPMAVNNINAALREIQEAINTPNENKPDWAKWPQDFQLYQVGEYDQDTGQLTGHEPQHIIDLHSLKSM